MIFVQRRRIARKSRATCYENFCRNCARRVSAAALQYSFPLISNHNLALIRFDELSRKASKFVLFYSRRLNSLAFVAAHKRWRRSNDERNKDEKNQCWDSRHWLYWPRSRRGAAAARHGSCRVGRRADGACRRTRRRVAYRQ